MALSKIKHRKNGKKNNGHELLNRRCQVLDAANLSLSKKNGPEYLAHFL